MTNEQISAELSRLKDAFPSFKKWGAELHKRGEALPMRNAWRAQLKPHEAKDVANVVTKMISGSIPFPDYFQFDRLGVIIKSEAIRIAGMRYDREQNAKVLERGERSQLLPETKAALDRFRESCVREKAQI